MLPPRPVFRTRCPSEGKLKLPEFRFSLVEWLPKRTKGCRLGLQRKRASSPTYWQKAHKQQTQSKLLSLLDQLLRFSLKEGQKKEIYYSCRKLPIEKKINYWNSQDYNFLHIPERISRHFHKAIKGGFPLFFK